MKVIAFNGSPRKEGNTYQAISIVFDELKKEDIEACFKFSRKLVDTYVKHETCCVLRGACCVLRVSVDEQYT